MNSNTYFYQSDVHTDAHAHILIFNHLTASIHTTAIHLDNGRRERKTTNPQCISPVHLNRKGTKREEAAVEGRAAERWGLGRREERALVDSNWK